MQTFGKRSISSFLKKVVDIAWYLQLFVAGLLLLFTILSVFNLVPESVLSHITVADSKNLETQVIISNDDIKQFADKPSLVSVVKKAGSAFLLFLGITIAVFFSISLYVTFLLKKILNSLSEGVPFTLENSKRIRFISYAILLSCPLNFIFEQVMYNMERAGSFSLSISFSDLTTLFLGAIIFIIAEIFRVGYEMQEEQKLII